MEFQGQQYALNQAESLFEFIDSSKPGEYTAYYDKLVFHTENGFIAVYFDDLLNCWSI